MYSEFGAPARILLGVHVTDDILAGAREMKTAALEALLAAGYSPARRIAHALTGNERVGRAVAGVMIQRSLRFLPRWEDPSTAENWFYHHAVLMVRGLVVPPPEPQLDPLVVHAPSANDPAYVAFVRALRHLPPQQREAFLLHHGERLNPRMLGVAMDCSVQAATTHLRAATDALDGVSQGNVEALAATLTRAYAGMEASEPEPTANVRLHVTRARRLAWLRRTVAVLVAAVGLVGLAWVAWVFRGEWPRMFNATP